MWAITTFFNPKKYEQRLYNFRQFRSELSIPLVVVELSFDGSFEIGLHEADIVVRINGGALVWQKERLLSIALQHVPKDILYIAWLDCDVLFGDSEWISKAIHELQRYPIVQLFSELVDLKKGQHRIPPNEHLLAPRGYGIAGLVKERAVRDTDFSPSNTADVRQCAFGLAWAARRELLHAHNFYDAMIIGGGDRAMVCAMYGRFNDAVNSLVMNSSRETHYLRWASPYFESVNGRVGHLPGQLFHLWHGDIQHRRYRERHKELSLFDLNPTTDLVVGANGAWEWRRDDKSLHSFFSQYFANRFEDGFDAL